MVINTFNIHLNVYLGNLTWKIWDRDEMTKRTLIFLPQNKKEYCAAKGCTYTLAAIKDCTYNFLWTLGRTYLFNDDIKTPDRAIKSLTSHQ